MNYILLPKFGQNATSMTIKEEDVTNDRILKALRHAYDEGTLVEFKGIKYYVDEEIPIKGE